MRLYSGPSFVLQTKVWILVLPGILEQPAVSVSTGGRDPVCWGNLTVGMLDVQNVSLQMHAICVHTKISMCFYSLCSDNLMILSDFVFWSNCWEMETFLFLLYLDLFSQKDFFMCNFIYKVTNWRQLNLIFFLNCFQIPSSISQGNSKREKDHRGIVINISM